MKNQLQEKQIPNPEMIIPITGNVNRAKTEMVIEEVEKSTAQKNHCNSIPKYI